MGTGPLSETNKTKRAVGGAHVLSTKLFPRLAVNKKIF